VRQIKLTYIGFRAHVKIASHNVSYRNVSEVTYFVSNGASKLTQTRHFLGVVGRLFFVYIGGLSRIISPHRYSPAYQQFADGGPPNRIPRNRGIGIGFGKTEQRLSSAVEFGDVAFGVASTRSSDGPVMWQ